MFGKVLVANRGEIAVRVIRALDELGVASVAVYSEIDRDALHVRRAGEAYLLGGPTAAESYLNVERILEVVRESGAQAVHPGYGFLAENAAFARACDDAGVVFIGPPAAAIEAMGSKTRARELMPAAGVPIVPGTDRARRDVDDARTVIADAIGYPVAVKAAGGGGGKGFRVALSSRRAAGRLRGRRARGREVLLRRDRLPRALPARPAPRRGAGAGRRPRQRSTSASATARSSAATRSSIEESPAPPAVDDALRERIGRIAVDAAEAVEYRGAGTVEGLLQDGEYFFLEMNTRVQVEHCVTEMTTGVDIVKEGIRAAAGEPLSVAQDDVVLRGHAIECRINAEDASRSFAPAPGRIGAYREPAGPGVRVDSGVGQGGEVSPMYDPMVAKLIVWDADREQATRRMLRALAEYEIEGLTTLIPFHRALLATEQWARGETCRDLLEDEDWLKARGRRRRRDRPDEDDEEAVEQTTPSRSRAGASTSRSSARRRRRGGPAPRRSPPGPAAPKPRRRAQGAGGGGARRRRAGSPLQGNMWKVLVEEGAQVEEGQLVCIIEAMKMENEITAHKAGTIAELPICEGAPVAAGDTIAVIRS